MIQAIRDLPKALAGLLQAINGLADLVHADVELRTAQGDFEARLEAVERHQATVESEVAAALTEVEARFRAARAAEERTRHALRRANGDHDEALEGDEEGPNPFQAYLEQLRRGDARGGEEEGVPPVHAPVATREQQKALIKARKWAG